MVNRRNRSLNWATSAVLILLVVCLWACSKPEGYIGVYEVPDGENSSHAGTEIELKEDHQGVWRTSEEEVTFRWDESDGDIRFRTREGGIVLGKISKDSLEVRLPGTGLLRFIKKGPA